MKRLAILNYASFYGLWCLAEKLSFKQYFYRNDAQCRKLQQMFEVQSFVSALTQAHNRSVNWQLNKMSLCAKNN